jgi:hypothetical protein
VIVLDPLPLMVWRIIARDGLWLFIRWPHGDVITASGS